MADTIVEMPPLEVVSAPHYIFDRSQMSFSGDVGEDTYQMADALFWSLRNKAVRLRRLRIASDYTLRILGMVIGISSIVYGNTIVTSVLGFSVVGVAEIVKSSDIAAQSSALKHISTRVDHKRRSIRRIVNSDASKADKDRQLRKIADDIDELENMAFDIQNMSDPKTYQMPAQAKSESSDISLNISSN